MAYEVLIAMWACSRHSIKVSPGSETSGKTPQGPRGFYAPCTF